MKRANVRTRLLEAGVDAEKIDELVNYIMDENGKDINLAKQNVDDDFAKLKAENETLKTSQTELTAKVDSYKDYDELKKFKAEYEANQEKTQKSEYLKSIGCKHPDLFLNQIDWSKASYDNDKKTYVGLDDAIKGLKETYKDMFEAENKGNPNLYNPNLNRGQNPAQSGLIQRALERNPNLKI